MTHWTSTGGICPSLGWRKRGKKQIRWAGRSGGQSGQEWFLRRFQEKHGVADYGIISCFHMDFEIPRLDGDEAIRFIDKF